MFEMSDLTSYYQQIRSQEHVQYICTGQIVSMWCLSNMWGYNLHELFPVFWPLQEEPDQAVSDLQSYAGRNQGNLPWRTIPRRHVQDYQSWCCWLLEEIFWWKVSVTSVLFLLLFVCFLIDVYVIHLSKLDMHTNSWEWHIPLNNQHHHF